MKKLFFLLALCVPVLWSCSDDDDDNTDDTVTPQIATTIYSNDCNEATTYFINEGNEAKIVKKDNYDWFSFEESTIPYMGKDTPCFILNVEQNESTSGRTAYIRLKKNNVEYQYKIAQGGKMKFDNFVKVVSVNFEAREYWDFSIRPEPNVFSFKPFSETDYYPFYAWGENFARIKVPLKDIKAGNTSYKIYTMYITVPFEQGGTADINKAYEAASHPVHIDFTSSMIPALDYVDINRHANVNANNMSVIRSGKLIQYRFTNLKTSIHSYYVMNGSITLEMP